MKDGQTENLMYDRKNGLMAMLSCDESAMVNPNQVLSELESHDILKVENFDSFVEGIKEIMRRKEILAKHRPPIKQMPSGRWYTRIDGKKVDKKNKKDVEDAVVAAYKEKEICIGYIFEGYLERRKMDVADTTWSKDVRYFNNFIKNSNIDKKPITSLALDDGYDFLKHCLMTKPDMKRRYWDNIYGCLNQIFQYAIDKRFIDSNPFINMKPKKDLFEAPTKTRDGDTVFTKKEQTLVCRLADEDSITTKSSEPLGIIVLFNLGIRDGELCALKWSDIESNLNRDYIHIQREMVAKIDENGKANGFKVLPHCKTPAGDRRLQLNDKAKEIFAKVKGLNEANGFPTGLDDYIFLRRYKGEITFCTPRSFDPRLRKYCKQAGMSVIKSPHDVRRTVLTNLYEAKMPLKKIQEFAGHSSLKQTMDYIRLSDEDLDMLQYLNTLSEEVESGIVSFRKEA